MMFIGQIRIFSLFQNSLEDFYWVMWGDTGLSTFCAMSSESRRIPAALHPRIRPPRPRAPLPSSEREERQVRAQERNIRINAVLEGFLAEANSVAAKMSNEFGLNHRQSLDLLFQGGVKMQHERNNPSAWSAFLSQKAIEAISGSYYCPSYLFSFLTRRS
jgi:hypothetical protein